MKRFFIKKILQLKLIIGLIFLITGCGFKLQKIETGKFSISIGPPSENSLAYPKWRIPWDKLGIYTTHLSGNITRIIPQGTQYFDLTIYNTNTNWYYNNTFQIPQDQTITYTIDSIPVGSNYTVEVFPYLSSDDPSSLVIGRVTDISITKDATATATLTLLPPSLTNIEVPSTVVRGEPFSITTEVSMPIDLNLGSTETPSIAAIFAKFNDSGEVLGGIYVYEQNPYSFIANQPQQIIINDQTIYIDASGNPIEDEQQIIPGTYYLAAIGFIYQQPVTSEIYPIVAVPANIFIEVQ